MARDPKDKENLRRGVKAILKTPSTTIKVKRDMIRKFLKKINFKRKDIKK